MDYTTWIDKHYPTAESAKNRCYDAANAMARQFPSLTVQYGFARGVMHCWCKDESGYIVDPTRKQFEPELTTSDYTFVSCERLRPDQVDAPMCIAFLDDGTVVVGK